MQATYLRRYRPSRALILKHAARRGASRVLRRVAKLGRRAVRDARIAFLTFKIDSTAQYLSECAVDGLHESLAIEEFCAQMSADIAEREALRSAP